MKKYNRMLKELNKEKAKQKFCWESVTGLPDFNKMDNKIKSIQELENITISKIEGIEESVKITLDFEISDKIKNKLIKESKKKKKDSMKEIVDKWESVK